MLTALILGGASGVWEEAAEARRLFTPGLLIATNHAGRDNPEPVDHWVSFHVELFPRWIAERARKGLPPAGQLWTAQRRIATDLDVRRVANWGGSSGLLAVTVALELGCERIVLCGVPLDASAHYDSPESWREFGNYRKAFITRQTQMTAVRSMSGWTRQLLGAPTGEWLHEGQESHAGHH